MPVLTLSILKKAFAITEARTTPHRTPDFTWIEQQVEGDPEVRGNIVFREEHNTGYDGALERWMFFMKDMTGEKISFMADLLPDIITTRSSEEDSE